MVTHRLDIRVLLLVVLPAASCRLDEPRESHDAASSRPELSSRVDAYIAGAMEWYGIPGLSIAVVSRGDVLHVASYGLADLESGIAATNATLYQLSSSAKIFSSTALMTLVENGLIELDAPVGQILPGTPAAWQHVTPRQLLAHISGLPDIVRCDTLHEAEAVACALELGDPRPPGERFEYNQTNYYLVQKLIERATGTSLPDYVADRMFEPLGVTGAVYAGDSAEPLPGRARSYYPDGNGGWEEREYHFPVYLYAAAGLNASLDAVVAWVRAMQAGRILAAGTREVMWHPPALNDGSVPGYALGWDVGRHGAGHVSVGHSGGRLTTVRLFPRDSLAVVVLANGSAWSLNPDEIAEGLAALVVPEIQSPGSRLASDMREALTRATAAADSFTATGTREALDIYVRFLSDPSPDPSVEGAMNELGYDLLERGLTAAAIEVLRLTAEAFPESWNAHDSLGEAYAESGNIELARAEYRRSLELNPDNDHAREVLRGLPAR